MPRETRACVELRASLDAGPHHRVVTLQDLSLHGAGIKATRVADLGREVSVRFRLPTGLVEARAEVRHTARHGKRSVGLRFLRLSREAEVAITEYLRALEVQGPGARPADHAP